MLFVFFVIVTPLVLWALLHFTSREKTETDGPVVLMEVCAICQNEFKMSELLEKEVGSYGRIYCFCEGCIESLYHESRNRTGIEIGGE